MKIKYRYIERNSVPHIVIILTCTVEDINHKFEKIPPKGFTPKSNIDKEIYKPYTFIMDRCPYYNVNLIHKIEGYISKEEYNKYLTYGLDEGIDLPITKGDEELSLVLTEIINNPNPEIETWTSILHKDDLEYDYERDVYINEDGSIDEDMDDIDYENDDRYELIEDDDLTEEEIEEIYDTLYEDI